MLKGRGGFCLPPKPQCICRCEYDIYTRKPAQEAGSAGVGALLLDSGVMLGGVTDGHWCSCKNRASPLSSGEAGWTHCTSVPKTTPGGFYFCADLFP